VQGVVALGTTGVGWRVGGEDFGDVEAYAVCAR